MGLIPQQRKDQLKVRNLSELVRRGELLVVVGDVTAESLISSGVLLRALRTLGVDFEFYLTVDPVDFGQLTNRVVGVEAYIRNCLNCVELAELKARRESPHVFRVVLEMVRDLVTLTREEYVLLLSSALTKYTPRSLASGLSEELLEFVGELANSGVIREVIAPRLIGWGTLPLEEIASYSVDMCALRFFGKQPADKVTEVDIARELKVESLKALEDRTYTPTFDAGILDAYEAAYIIEYLIDVEGPEYAVFTPLNYSYFLWAVRSFRSSTKSIRKCVDMFLEKSFDRKGQFYVLECDIGSSGTVVTKILKGLRLIEENAFVAFRVSDNYYIPLQLLTRSQRAKLSGTKTIGGYAILDNAALLKLQKS